MPRSLRRLLVWAVAVVGIILMALGVVEFRELLVVGKVPPERLGRQVAFTTIQLAVGLGLIVWCLVASKTWARGGKGGTAGDETRTSGGR